MPKLINSEAELHLAVANYLKYRFPDTVFTSDFAAGMHLPIWLAKRQKALRSSRGYPDIFVAEPKGDYHGLFLELKKEGTVIFKRDGTVRASKKDNYAEQHAIHQKLLAKGYYAEFVIGYNHTVAVIDWYMAGALDGPTFVMPDKPKDDGLAF